MGQWTDQIAAKVKERNDASLPRAQFLILPNDKAQDSLDSEMRNDPKASCTFRDGHVRGVAGLIVLNAAGQIVMA